jgi:hypothetical protein
MPLDLGDITLVTLVADQDTPAGLADYAGVKVPLPDGVTLPATLDSITFNGVTLWGYTRVNSATGNTEFLISRPENPMAVFLDSLPGPAGWLNADARQAARQVGVRMMRDGASQAELRWAFRKIWDAIVAERNAQILAAGGTLAGPAEGAAP